MGLPSSCHHPWEGNRQVACSPSWCLNTSHLVLSFLLLVFILHKWQAGTSWWSSAGLRPPCSQCRGPLSSSPGQGTGFHMLQLKILCATTKTLSRQQINLGKWRSCKQTEDLSRRLNYVSSVSPFSASAGRSTIVTTFPVFLFCCYSIFSQWYWLQDV